MALLTGLAGVAGCVQQAPADAPTLLDCGAFEFPTCSGPERQFDPSFVEAAPEVTERVAGGFGGAANCTPRRTPVVFVHGNGDRAITWDSGITGPVGDRPAAPRSVYDEFRAAGYTGCELFGLTYLTEAERGKPMDNYHEPARYAELLDFIAAVRDYTSSERVDIVAHSFGVSLSMAALTWQDETQGEAGWAQVRRFVNIAGGLRGVGACRTVGYANPLAKGCGSQNLIDPYTFGFYPDIPGYALNGWTGSADPHSLRAMPARHPEVDFHTITAGAYDQVLCGAADDKDCTLGALFDPGPNVRSQLDVGTGTPASEVDLDLSDGAVYNLEAGDRDGVGHFKARNNTGTILVAMLTTDCREAECARSYAYGPVTAATPS